MVACIWEVKNSLAISGVLCTACFAQQARPQESLYPFPLRINRVSTEVTAAPMFVIRKYSHLNLMENVYHWVAVT